LAVLVDSCSFHSEQAMEIVYAIVLSLVFVELTLILSLAWKTYTYLFVNVYDHVE
jgi:hypothetical protein